MRLGGADMWPHADTSLCSAFSGFYLQDTCWPVFRHIPPEQLEMGPQDMGACPPFLSSVPLLCPASHFLLLPLGPMGVPFPLFPLLSLLGPRPKPWCGWDRSFRGPRELLCSSL